MIGAELMARAVERQGVQTVFGLPGHLEIFFGALQDRGMGLINMRHEAAVVTAADGYARARRGLGVACVTAGPGLANALGGLVTAFEACTPLLLFSGRNPFATLETGIHQEMDHPRAVRAMTKWAATVHDPSRLGEYIDRACQIALSGRPGPVLLDVPRDVAQAEVSGEIAEESLRPLIRPAPPMADAGAVARAAQLLGEAENPLIITGNGAYWSGAGAGLNKLAQDFRMPVMGKALGRGLVPEDGEVGFSWAVAHPAAKQADVVLLAGSRQNMAIGYCAPPFFRPDARFIQIDLEAAEIGRNRPVEVPIIADCAQAVEAIAGALAGQHNQPKEAGWVGAAIADRLARIDQVGREEEGLVHPLRMARELAQRMPDDALFIGDGANCLNWFKAVLRTKASPGWMDQDPFGSMGVGLPLAIGAVAAEQEKETPRPVYLGTGDGSLGQYLSELSSAALHGLPLFVMVANDGGWGASRSITRRLFGGSYGVEMNQSRYDLVAEGLDCVGELAAEPGEVGPAFDRALAAVAAGRPALVNVVVDPESGNLRGTDPHLQMVTFNPTWPGKRS